MNLNKTSSVALLLLLLLLVCSRPVLAQDGAQLFITTTPKDVTIRILNLPGTFQQGMKLQPGTYLIRVSKQGYEPQTKKVTLSNTGEFTLKVALQALAQQPDEKPQAPPADDEEQPQASADAGHLFVLADPPDATIRILRIKPVFKQGIALEPGKYLVEVSKEGYSTKKREVLIKKGQDSKVEIALFLKADMGKLYVNTDPMDANVRLPHIKPKYEPGMELSPGDYTVEISKEGFKTITTDVKIVDGKIKRLNVTLKKLSAEEKAHPEAQAGQEAPPPPHKGTLTIQLSPADADVRILDIDQPYTPGMELESGFYVLEAKKAGYVTATNKVAIKPDQAATISISLAEEPGKQAEPAPAQEQPAEQTATRDPGKERLFITPVPADAQVRILNIGPQYTPGLELGPGKYEVEVRKEGLGKVLEIIEVLPGQDVHATIDLSKGKKQPEPPAPATGTLAVETNLANPVITIDGKPGFNQESKLDPGEYQVEVSGEFPGTEKTIARQRSVTIAAGQTTTLKVLVAPEPEPAPKAEQTSPDKTATAPAAAPEKKTAKAQPPMVDDADSLRTSALEAINRKEYAQALQLVRQALALSTPDAELYTLLGRIYVLMGDNVHALEAYGNTIKLTPEKGAAYAARGEVYVRLNDTESACYDFWKACALGKCKEIGLAKKNGICR